MKLSIIVKNRIITLLFVVIAMSSLESKATQVIPYYQKAFRKFSTAYLFLERSKSAAGTCFISYNGDSESVYTRYRLHCYSAIQPFIEKSRYSTGRQSFYALRKAVESGNSCFLGGDRRQQFIVQCLDTNSTNADVEHRSSIDVKNLTRKLVARDQRLIEVAQHSQDRNEFLSALNNIHAETLYSTRFKNLPPAQQKTIVAAFVKEWHQFDGLATIDDIREYLNKKYVSAEKTAHSFVTGLAKSCEDSSDPTVAKLCTDTVKVLDIVAITTENLFQVAKKIMYQLLEDYQDEDGALNFRAMFDDLMQVITDILSSFK